MRWKMTPNWPGASAMKMTSCPFFVWPAGSANLFDPDGGLDPDSAGIHAENTRMKTVFQRLKSRQCLAGTFDALDNKQLSDLCSNALGYAIFYSPDIASFDPLSTACNSSARLALYYHCYAYRWGITTMPIFAMALHCWHPFWAHSFYHFNIY